MATADFEMKQLLKAYRKGLISDDLFEQQMSEVKNGSGQGYTYNGKMHATEREMIMHLLDEARCGENFAAEYFNRWIEVSDQVGCSGIPPGRSWMRFLVIGPAWSSSTTCRRR